MLRSLVDEMVRRRLWPIMLVALLAIIAAPLLFLKSAPDDAPAASEAPPSAQPGELPAGAERLVTESDKATTPRDDASRPRQDPFAPPASAQASKDATASATPANAPAQSESSGGAVRLPNAVITNPDGSKTTIETNKPSTGKKTTPKSGSKPAPKPTPAPRPKSPSTSDTSFASVTVRFAKDQKSKARRGIPRLETFKAGDAVAAMFVKYSPARKQAVFAIAPTTRVSGDVKCQRVRGVCRYVNIPEGKHARLTVWTPKGRIINRRLDVVSIKTAAEVAASNIPAPASRPTRTTVGEARCLVRFLLALPSFLPSIPADTCQ